MVAFRKKLERERERLAKDVKDIEEGMARNSQAEYSGENSYEDDFADSGTATFERERDLSLKRNAQVALDQVNSALTKISEGEYGVCTSCGDEIDPARLKALPYVDMCIKCKKREEDTGSA